MNQTESILGQLRDVQLPPAPEGISSGLMLANLVVLLFIVLGLYRHWRRGREQWRRDALSQVRQARTMEPAVAILSLAKLLKQIFLYRYPTTSNDGQHWLEELDGFFATHWFTQEQGQIFGRALYKPVRMNQDELQQLCTQLEKLIRRLPTKPRSNYSQKNTLQNTPQDPQAMQ